MQLPMERIKQKLVAVTEEYKSRQYDAWSESRKALAHELLAFMAEVERSLPGPVQLLDPSTKSRSEAWGAVCEVLNRVAPEWINEPGTGVDCMERTINRLAALNPPKINVVAEVKAGVLTGSTSLDVSKINPEDDGSYTAIVLVDQLPSQPTVRKVRAFTLLADHYELKAGQQVFAFMGCDYGLASEDTRNTGMNHQSVTLKDDGSYPAFSVPTRDLRPI